MTRSKAVIDELKKFAHVDVLLSGENFGLEKSIGFENVKYQVEGVGMKFSAEGKFKYTENILKNTLAKVFTESMQVDLSGYDMVITDTEAVSAIAAKTQHVKCLGISNFYTYLTKRQSGLLGFAVPIQKIGLKMFGGDENISVYYDKLDDNTTLPILSKEILDSAKDIKDLGHITVYLSTVALEVLTPILKTLPKYKFEVFSPKIKQESTDENITFKTNAHKGFANSIGTAHGIIMGAGFSATAEALYLGKKMMLVPVNHIEQQLNSEYLQKQGVKVIKSLKEDFKKEFADWEINYEPVKKDYANVLPGVMEKIKEFNEKPVKHRNVFDISPLELLNFLKHFY